MGHVSNDELDFAFCDTAGEGAKIGLLALMSGISEESWCATWMTGLERALWNARENGPGPYGQIDITERQATLLRLLSEEAGGWWIWDDGERFVSLETWRAMLVPQQPPAGDATDRTLRNSES